ncbi:LPXTG cell wall anchor domain-containing protein [Gemmiger formicilis]|uniref:LPXTG cell wall anchor domain-containing protein n=1 Tax=Gemmiger formicilis TaxID=745368 RepID=UPI0030774315
MKKKVLSLLLTLCLAMTFLPMAAFAEGTSVDNWDGSADTSWYVGHEIDTEYHITTAEQLAGLAELTNIGIDTGASTGNTFENKIIYLDCDLDLGGYPWTPITNRNVDDGYFFKGTFDGKGHTIYNLNRHGIGNDSFDSLFGYVQGGVIKNLNVVDADLSANDYSMHVGIIAALVENGKIINCYTSGTVESVNGWRSIGGITGSCMQGTQIVGCGSDANIISRESTSSDSVGGLVGEWLNANETSVISDCWFNGSIVSEDPESTVGGLLAVGYNNNVEENVKINNCMMVSSDLSSAEKESTAVIAHLTGTPTVADCFYKESDNGYRVITKLDKGSLAIDTSFDPTPCAKAITDFTDNDILVSLQNNASQGVVWVEGIEHPTFVWDDNNILADYTAVEAAIARATALDSSLYTNYSAVEDSINAVDRTKSKAKQTEVNAMAKAIEDAVSALQYKGADYTKVDAAIAKANALNKDNYKDLTAVEAAVNAVVRDKNITDQSEVDTMAQAIEDAITALQYKDADYTKVDAALAKANALKKDDYKDFSAVETAVNAVARGKNITEQAEVDAMAKAIEDAIAALQYKDADKTTPAPAATATPAPAATATPAPAATATPQYTIPQTGDTSNPALLVVLMLVSGSAAIGTAVVASKRKNNR